MTFDSEELNTASLAQLGIILMDTVDNETANGDFEALNEAYRTIGKEVVRRVERGRATPLSTEKTLRHLMDFHYKKWADLQEKGENGKDLNDAFYELKALMTGFTELTSIHEDEDGGNQLFVFLRIGFI